MTQKEAKELTLELWEYLAEHPECRHKSHSPPELRDRIRNLWNCCPLCDCFICSRFCDLCPLCKAGEQCGVENSLWHIWRNSREEDREVRKKAAERIVEIVSAWEPEEQGVWECFTNAKNADALCGFGRAKRR